MRGDKDDELRDKELRLERLACWRAAALVDHTADLWHRGRGRYAHLISGRYAPILR